MEEMNEYTPLKGNILNWDRMKEVYYSFGLTPPETAQIRLQNGDMKYTNIPLAYYPSKTLIYSKSYHPYPKHSIHF